MEARPRATASLEPPVGNYFVSTYRPFACWDDRGKAAFRRRLDDTVPSTEAAPLGLYIHIPFCAERCRFCYHLSHDDRSAEIDRYLDALTGELSRYGETPRLAGRKPESVYFGGGTPSLLSTSRLEKLLHAVQRVFPWTAVREATFECAPKSVTQAKCRALHEAGITRVSLGVQQLDDEVLRRNGRIHLVRDVERAYEAIRGAGFDLINVDLMTGLEGQTDESFDRGLDRVIELSPESVTIYQLEIPFNTPLYRAIQSGASSTDPTPWAERHARLARGLSRLEASGYTVRSAYAAVRDPNRHRFVHQEEQYRGADLLGVGVASFSYLDGVHQQNLGTLERYLEALADSHLPLGRGHRLSAAERLVREFVLQLKLGAVDANDFRIKFGEEISECFAGALSHFVNQGWVTVDDEVVKLTREGLLRVDRLIPAFYLPQHQGVRYS